MKTVQTVSKNTYFELELVSIMIIIII